VLIDLPDMPAVPMAEIICEACGGPLADMIAQKNRKTAQAALPLPAPQIFFKKIL
jgi:hypothetical protein